MKFPKELTTITPTSKILAAILFISLPFIGFFLGIRYQQTISPPSIITNYSTPTPDETANISQGAMGKIEIAPTCAGPGSPPGRPEEICSKPFEGTVIVKKKNTKKEITRFTTNSEGKFTIELSEGSYTLEPITTVGLPGPTKQFDLVVTANKVTQVTISIDTGIR